MRKVDGTLPAGDVAGGDESLLRLTFVVAIKRQETFATQAMDFR